MKATEVVVLPRRGGKTHRMLEWMAAQPKDERRVCVTFSAREADRLRRVARDMGLDVDDWQFIEPYSMNARGRLPRPVYAVDNAEMVLSVLLGGPVDMVTVTGRADHAPGDVDRLANVLHDIDGEFCNPFTEYHPIAMHRSQAAAILSGLAHTPSAGEGLDVRELLDLFDRCEMYPGIRAAIREVLAPQNGTDHKSSSLVSPEV